MADDSGTKRQEIKQGEKDAAIQRLLSAWASEVRATHGYRGDATAEVKREKIVEICRFLRDDPDLSFNFLMDLTVVDRLGAPGERFEVVYHLYSLKHGRRVRLKAKLPGDDPVIDSVIPVWPGADWHEREAYDMYGVQFRNHPDLRRILLYPEFKGFPLRKDYPKEKIQPLVRIEDMEEESEGGRKRA